jgi:hypothetical protein
MKLQCPCGAKYAFDLAPEMVQNPVTFVCPTCGLDSSEFVNEMVRKEFGAPAPEYTPPVSAPPPVAPAPAPRLKISHHEQPAETASVAPAESAPVSKYCQKHRGVLATEQCTLCGKPICPQCLDIFGYFCSALCKNKADMQGIAAPEYEGGRNAAEKKFWRKAGAIFAACALVIGGFIGLWTWYAWFGSVPHPKLSVKFEDTDRAYAGKSHLVGEDQFVFLHGGTLARYDLKSKKQIWKQELISPAQLAAALKAEQDYDAASNAGGGYQHHVSQTEMERSARIGLQRELLLRVSGKNIWVGKGDKLTRYDWDTGSVAKEITLPEPGESFLEKDGELLLLGAGSVTHVSLATGESRIEQFRPPGAVTIAAGGNAPSGGLFAKEGEALDPQKVAAEAQNLKVQGRVALPALLANAKHEKDLEAALNDIDPKHPRAKNSAATVPMETFELVRGETGFVQFSRKLLEEKIIERSAMKAAPKKSALDGEVNAAHTGEIANEILNEMQRNAGADKVTEDVSRYQVTVHIPETPASSDWKAEVAGPPQLFVLKTVNVVAAGRTVIVLDKANKKLWETTLTYPIASTGGELLSAFLREDAQFGEGPVVEHGDALYVFDQAVLSAFELSSGNARWRVPSVGVAGLFFDDAGSIYVNTTSANPDDIKYSRQIDITKQTDNVLLKLDPKTGKQLWNIKPGGFISYLHGKYIYTYQSYDPNPTDEDVNDMAIQKPPYFRIARINPKNGRLLWEYYDAKDRCPIDIRFADNTITLVFKKEVQVLKYLTF